MTKGLPQGSDSYDPEINPFLCRPCAVSGPVNVTSEVSHAVAVALLLSFLLGFLL